MNALRKTDDQMTIAEFLGFVATRPDEERWELVEGVPRINAAPTNFHQIIAGNVYAELRNIARRSSATWVPVLGIGTRVPVSPNSLPQPDVQVLEHGTGATASSTTSDSLVLFEIMSKSNTAADQAWRKRVYASIPNLQHYVVVSQKAAQVKRFDRRDEWNGLAVTGRRSNLSLPALGKTATIALDEIYWGTPIR